MSTVSGKEWQIRNAKEWHAYKKAWGRENYLLQKELPTLLFLVRLILANREKRGQYIREAGARRGRPVKEYTYVGGGECKKCGARMLQHEVTCVLCGFMKLT